MGFRVWGFGFKGLGLRVWGRQCLGVYGLWFGARVLGFNKFRGVGLSVLGVERLGGLGFKVLGFGFRV